MYPIYGFTGCHVGSHVWEWSGVSTMPNEPPDDNQRCRCGRYTWSEAATITESSGATPPDAGKETER
jgi:hypothetical protein